VERSAISRNVFKGPGDTTLQGGKPVDALKFYQESIALSMRDTNMQTLQQRPHSAGQVSMDLGKIALMKAGVLRLPALHPSVKWLAPADSRRGKSRQRGSTASRPKIDSFMAGASAVATSATPPHRDYLPLARAGEAEHAFGGGRRPAGASD